MRRRTVQVLAVLVAMALGHLITSTLDVGDNPATAAPFIHTGDGDDVVNLDYGTVQVTSLRAARYLAPQISTEFVKQAGGVWVVVDLRLVAAKEPIGWGGLDLVDAHDRIYVPSLKSGCPSFVRAQTGVPTYAMICFDVPKDDLEGLRVRAARGSLADDGQRRDDVADIDLGIDAAKAEELLAVDDVWKVHFAGTQPIEHDTVEVKG